MTSTRNSITGLGTAAAAMGLAMLLSGCAFSGSSTGKAVSGGSTGGQARVSGSVFGGQQPVSLSTIQLYTVGTSALGSASAPLISATVMSNASGSFSITGDYSCTGATPGTQVYITATGGNAGSGSNTSINMMAALGSCATLLAGGNSVFININELTTVAAVYALAPFMTDYTHIGAVGSNPTGLVNAFATAAALVNAGAGQIAAPPAGITLPVTRLNTLADILAACINTTGSTSTQCTTLFSTTGSTETIGAMLAIAKNPGSAAYTPLYTLANGTSPFMPTLTAQPNDFTLAINYTGTELQGPYGVAVDAAGNAWVSNEAGASVVKVPHPAAGFVTSAYTGAGTILAPRGVSIDRTGNVWIANTGGNNVVELSSAGVVLSAAGYTGGGLSGPVAIANDSAGNAWVANLNGNSITELGSNGTPAAGSPLSGSGALSQPTAIALDSTGRVLVANAGSGAYCTFSSAGVFQSCPNDGRLLGATGIAVNSSTVVMSGSTTGTAVAGAFTLASNGGTVNAASPIAGGGLALPTAVALDGGGRSWFANTASISEFAGTTSVSPATGFNGINSPGGIAVDASGNVWTANTGDNSVSIFVGVATPVGTPLALNVGP